MSHPTTEEPLVTDKKKLGEQKRWWWYIRFFDTDDEAKTWTPAAPERLVYCCWRAHKAPTTGKAHVHVLAHFKSGMRFGTLQSGGARNIKFCENDTKR